MPVEFQVVTNNCEIVSQVLDAGIPSYLADRAVKPEFQYSCIETMEPALTAWQIFLTIYVVALMPAIVGWAVLYFKGKQADKFFKWGALSFCMPLVGPFLALIPVDENSGFVNKMAVNRKLGIIRKSPSQGNRHANDAN